MVMAFDTLVTGRIFQRLAHIPLFAALVIAACSRPEANTHRLPTGVSLDPAGSSIELGSMPLAMAFSPDSARVVVLLCGLREQGIQVVDPIRRKVRQTLVQPAAFLGLAFAPDGHSLFASGGNQDVVYRYAWHADSATLADSIRLDPKGAVGQGARYPSGLGFSPDGRWLYVAENLADSLAVVDLGSGRVVQRVATGRYPYGVVVGPDGRVYVSAWGGSWIAAFNPRDGRLVAGSRIPVGRHPSALALNARGTRLFVARASYDRIAVVETGRDSVIAELSDAAAQGPPEGATPNGLALSRDGRTLYVAEADNNATAVFALGRATSDAPGAEGGDKLLGRVPVEWYPTAVLLRDQALFVLNGKGLGTGPNPRRRQPGVKAAPDARSYTLGQTTGSLTAIAVPTGRALDALSRRVARAEGPRAVTPNHHALAERFGLYDRFFVNAEVSGDGHDWTTAAYAPDYVEKTIPSLYSDRGRSYDFEGENRDTIPEDDVNETGTGYLWDAAARAGITMRNYGEFALRDHSGRWTATKPLLAANTAPAFPGWDLDITDQKRVDAWLEEFRGFVAAGRMPALSFLRLPNDHTAGGKAGAPTPRAYVADNDLALGRVIEALSRSPFWKNTIVFVVEDDAQDGPDHVDSHRSPLLVVSAYTGPGVVHRFANTSDVVATIGDILKLESLSQFDHFGRPLTEIYSPKPDLSPYAAIVPRVPLDERNRAQTAAARETRRLNLAREDPGDEDLFNRILWAMIKGPRQPYPGKQRVALLERQRG
ncbi:MAG: bifunctional YncE family protein/alkaline phosphatase family protein [Candidatus Eisenbacteria bacterium]|uniref:Bifunctional YncE family protein/alkaline phosphatase family protein n=1 Tax=Eiseniibacteriota bacterium TaxID=2212470 RepID=A0A538SX73_UNCEI|nr:MAG: bifunctional YncE family protein/alkaline phosphatase family protein [Candidatus Eisenbacteria bacterium]